MLYQLYESQRAMLSPFSEFASATSKLYSHPLSPLAHTPLSNRMSAGLDLMHRLSKEYEKPPFGITSVKVDGRDVAVQEQVALEKPFCRLLRFKRFTDDLDLLTKMKDQPVVLVVAEIWGNHEHIKDVVRRVAKALAEAVQQATQDVLSLAQEQEALRQRMEESSRSVGMPSSSSA